MNHLKNAEGVGVLRWILNKEHPVTLIYQCSWSDVTVPMSCEAGREGRVVTVRLCINLAEILEEKKVGDAAISNLSFPSSLQSSSGRS